MSDKKDLIDHFNIFSAFFFNTLKWIILVFALVFGYGKVAKLDDKPVSHMPANSNYK